MTLVRAGVALASNQPLENSMGNGLPAIITAVLNEGLARSAPSARVWTAVPADVEALGVGADSAAVVHARLKSWEITAWACSGSNTDAMAAGTHMCRFVG